MRRVRLIGLVNFYDWGVIFWRVFLEYLLWCRPVVKVILKLTQMIHYAKSKNQMSLDKNYSENAKKIQTASCLNYERCHFYRRKPWEKLGIGDELALADQSKRPFRPSAFLTD
jgi:hypothetical protein